MGLGHEGEAQVRAVRTVTHPMASEDQPGRISHKSRTAATAGATGHDSGTTAPVAMRGRSSQTPQCRPPQPDCDKPRINECCECIPRLGGCVIESIRAVRLCVVVEPICEWNRAVSNPAEIATVGDKKARNLHTRKTRQRTLCRNELERASWNK